jgi:hypothetical protein
MEHDHGAKVGTDCHCKAGYEGRLCSRCSCDSTGDCYFSSGEIEERHCTKCQTTSIAVVVSAFATLQLSLVIFLLFQKSALALLLAEVAIVITLVLAGIGESWMFNLVIIMGLLFVVTSLSRRAASAPKADRGSMLVQDSNSHILHDGDIHHDDDDGSHVEHHESAQVAALAKIIIFFFQSASAVIQDSAWPSWISQAMKYLEAVNLRVSGVECFAPSILSSPLGKLLFQLAMPILLGVNLAIAAVFASAIIKIDPVKRAKSLLAACKSERRKPNNAGSDVSDSEPSFRVLEGQLDESEPSDPLIERSVSASNPSTVWNVGDLLSRLQFSFFFLLSASYFELSSTVLEMLRPCSKQGFMQAIPWVQCSLSDRTYFSLLATAIAFLLIYSLGIPAIFGFVLIRNRRRIQAGDPVLESKYGFLYESYKVKFYWFELIWFLRRILLSMAISLMAAPPGYQMAMIFLILQGSLLLHRAIKPFSSHLANLMDQIATATLLFGVVMGFVLNIYKDAYHKHVFALQNVVWVCVAVVALAIIVALVAPSIRFMITSLRQKLRKE